MRGWNVDGEFTRRKKNAGAGQRWEERFTNLLPFVAECNKIRFLVSISLAFGRLDLVNFVNLRRRIWVFCQKTGPKPVLRLLIRRVVSQSIHIHTYIHNMQYASHQETSRWRRWWVTERCVIHKNSIQFSCHWLNKNCPWLEILVKLTEGDLYAF